MKPFKTIISALFFPVFLSAQTGTDTNSVSNLPPVKYDYKKCVFTIKADNWTKQFGRDVLPLTTMITNNSEDTLRYDMESNWLIYYAVDNKNLSISGGDYGLKNIPQIIILPPHKSDTLQMNLYKNADGDFHGEFKLKFCLVIERNVRLADAFSAPIKDVAQRTHYIWSNTIQM